MKRQVRQLVLEKYNSRCAYCGFEIDLKTMQIDHIIPKIQKGSEDISNLNPACRSCNNWKTFHSVDFFKKELNAQIERLNLRSSNYRIAKRYGLIKETGKEVRFFYEQTTETF